MPGEPQIDGTFFPFVKCIGKNCRWRNGVAIALYIMGMTTTDTQSRLITRRQEQLTLFPDEEDSLLYDSSEAYKRLTPTEKAIVRACLVEIYINCKWPTQTRISEAAGVSRPTVQKYLSDKSSLVHAAISQIAAAHGGDMCRRCRDIIPQIALMILKQVNGGRSTSSITPTEFNMLKLATEMGGIPLSMTSGAPPVNVNIAAQASGNGAQVGVQITSEETDALSAYLFKLSASQRLQPGAETCEPPLQSATPFGGKASCAPGEPSADGSGIQPDGHPECLEAPVHATARDAFPMAGGDPSQAVPNRGCG